MVAAEVLAGSFTGTPGPSPSGNISSAPDVRPSRMLSGNSLAIRRVTTLIRQVAAHDSTVLLLGESGTGKEVAARTIHELSPRRHRPFVAVNCGAIPGDLLESELFGHEKGSFTGAITTRKGRFEIAEGGTLFLDEIGDMSVAMQVKLLRVLQERVFERVGNHVAVSCNVRIIAATHRNLEESIARGSFREDLFHRLNVFPIDMPPLRDRIEDLPMLVREFIAQNAAEGRGRVQLSAAALATLSRHSWTGNVRELANLIERLSIVCAGRRVEIRDLPERYRPAERTESAAAEVASDDMVALAAFTAESSDAIVIGSEALADPAVMQVLETGQLQADGEAEADTPLPAAAATAPEVQLPAEGLDLRAYLTAIERALIEQALAQANGTVAHAARLLNLRRTTLVEKLRKLGIGTAECLTED